MQNRALFAFAIISAMVCHVRIPYLCLMIVLVMEILRMVGFRIELVAHRLRHFCYIKQLRELSFRTVILRESERFKMAFHVLSFSAIFYVSLAVVNNRVPLQVSYVR